MPQEERTEAAAAAAPAAAGPITGEAARAAAAPASATAPAVGPPRTSAPPAAHASAKTKEISNVHAVLDSSGKALAVQADGMLPASVWLAACVLLSML